MHKQEPNAALLQVITTPNLIPRGGGGGGYVENTSTCDHQGQVCLQQFKCLSNNIRIWDIMRRNCAKSTIYIS